MPAYGATSDLRWQSLHADQAEDWSALTMLAARVDGLRETYSAVQLRETLESPGFNSETQTVSAWSGDRLVGVSAIWPNREPRFDGVAEVTISLFVHPHHRRDGLGAQLLERSHSLGSDALRRFTDRPGVFRVEDPSRRGWMKALLTSHGYSLSRVFHSMERDSRSLAIRDAAPRDASVVLRAPRSEDLWEMLDAHNDAFSRHWGSSPVCTERWAKTMWSPSTHLGRSRIVLDANERVLSYAIVGQFAKNELHVLLVGTRTQHQKKGLGNAVLSEVLRTADADTSIERVVIEADSQSESHPGDLYTSLGFKTVSVRNVYERLWT